MPIRKIAEIKLKAGPYGRLEAVGSGFKFYSYDKDSAAIDFYFREQNGSPTDILGCTTELVLLTKEDGQQKKLTIIDSEVEIISALKGHARYVIPDRLRGYVGLVQGYVYLNFPDESRTDECRFDFTIERSLIEEEFENGGDYYIKDIQVIFDEVKDTLNSKIPEMQTKYDDLVKTFTDYANEKIAEYDSRFVTLNSNLLTLQDSLTTAQNKVTTLEQSIATANTNLNTRINEINKKIDDNDVFTKQESSANVIDQVIGKVSNENKVIIDLKGKIVGSAV
ncbi:MAG: BppU family phage baseplate upper protein, partial [Clostridium sp.]|nr:BppU family phage baseplate upper protein [Clostridium sp.]